MYGRISQAAAVIVVFALLISGCTSQASNIGMAKDNEGKAVDTGFTVAAVGSYDSADTAVVISTDQQNNSVTFMNMGTGKQYTLYYDGTTYVKDRYEGPMTISQIRAGDVVDVNFLKGKRQIASIQLSPAAWIYDNVENYDLGGINKTASIGSSTYSLPDDVVVLSEGKRVEVMDIVKQDVVSIQGIDHRIYSINVERGHGYIRLKNDQPLIGGWIEVGNTVIREITEDMLLVVPEGDYQVFLSNKGATCTKSVTIERDKEVVLDVGDLEIPENKTGRILFSVTPENAKVTIDHKEVDISSPVELQYGIHQVHLEANGYDSLTKYIQVGSEYAKISFTLEEQKENDVPSVSQNNLEREDPDLLTEEDKPKADSVSSNDLFSVSDNTLSASSGNKVYIDSPKGVEVYLDGNYVGVAPVSFKKKVGSHTITLRRSGYQTKSYTIYLYDDKEDITYSFTDLERENTNQSAGNSNTSSTSTTSSQRPPDEGNKPSLSGNDSGSSGGDDNSNKPSGGDETGNEGGDETGNEGGDETGNEGGDETGNEGGDETGNEGGDETENEGGDETENGGGDETKGDTNPDTTSSDSTVTTSVTDNMKGIVTNSVSTFNQAKQIGK